MGRMSRDKGRKGEREVARAFEADGWAVRGLESSGDHITVKTTEHRATADRTITLHIEAKRAERLRIPEWLEQARTEAPPGVPPLVVFRQNAGQWHAVLSLSDLLGLIG